MSSHPSYIVLLRPDVDKRTHFDRLSRGFPTTHFSITHNYSVLHGYAAKLHDQVFGALVNSPDVRKVEEDVEFEWEAPIKVEEHSGWGLNRISQIDSLKGQNALSDNFHYTYEDLLDVDIYIIEGGCRITHEDFGGRATYGYTDPDLNSDDNDKHGTEVTSAAGGKRCGVAKHANLIICRTHNKTANSIATLDWIIGQYNDKQIPAVINMSFGRKDPDHQYTALDEAVTNTVEAGIHCVVAAGNANWDANNTTPARADGANAIAASNIDDKRCKFSNYGDVIKVFAPGAKVLTADAASDTAYSYNNGTSFSSPYVAGLIAYHISLTGNTAPADMSQWLQDTAIPDVLSRVPDGTPNLLAYNSVMGYAGSN